MKKTTAGLLLAAMTGCAMVMSSFAGEVTVDEILENMQTANAEIKELSAKADMAADVSLEISDQYSMSVTGNYDLDVACMTDPLQFVTSGTMEYSMDMMGETDGQSMDMSVYMVPDEDDVLVMYVGTDQGEGMEWIKSSLGEESTQQIQSLLETSMGKQMPDLPIEFTLADETVDVEGTECYELTSVLTVEDILNIYNAIIEQYQDELPEEVISQMPDEETISSFAAMLSGLQFNVLMDVDAENYRLMHMHVDLDGSDWVTLGAVIGMFMAGDSEDGELPSVSLDVKALYLDYVYDYSTPVEVVVPDEVIEAAVDTGEVGDYVEELEELETGLEELETEF